MGKIIPIGKTQIEVRLTHSKKSVLYFIKEIFPEIKLNYQQEEIIKFMEKSVKDQQDENAEEDFYDCYGCPYMDDGYPPCVIAKNYEIEDECTYGRIDKEEDCPYKE